MIYNTFLGSYWHFQHENTEENHHYNIISPSNTQLLTIELWFNSLNSSSRSRDTLLLTGVDLSADVLRMLPTASDAVAGNWSDGEDDDNSCVSPSINMLRLRIIVTSASREFLMVIVIVFASFSISLPPFTTHGYLIIISRLLQMAINSASTQQQSNASECVEEQAARKEPRRFNEISQRYS